MADECIIRRRAGGAGRLPLDEPAHGSPRTTRAVLGQAERTHPGAGIEVGVVKGQENQEEEEGGHGEERARGDAAETGFVVAATPAARAWFPVELLSILVDVCVVVALLVVPERLVRCVGGGVDGERLGRDRDHYA